MADNLSDSVAARRGYLLGALGVALGGVCISLGGILIRLVEQADGWQILFWRSVFYVLSLLTVLALRNGRALPSRFAAIGLRGAFAALCLSGTFVAYVFAVLTTTVANVVFILSSGPFFAALLGWAVLGEKVRPATWMAIAATIAGIGLMMTDGLARGDWLGNVLALGAVMCFAIMLVTVRGAGEVDMLPATCLGGVIPGLVALGLAAELVPTWRDLLLIALMGTVQLGAGFGLITWGAGRLPAAEVSLLVLTEVVLAPLWVWFFLGEVPAELALLGGCIVVTAVVGQSLARLRHRPTPLQSPQM